MKVRKFTLFLFTAFFVLVLAVCSHRINAQTSTSQTGKIYYVSPSGNDTNTGTSKLSAFATIQKAASVTNPGDTVLVMNGTYTNVHSGWVVNITRSGKPNAWITYKAYPGHTPKIKHNAWHGILIDHGASYIRVSGFEIEGNSKNITLEYAQSQQSNPLNPLSNGNCLSIDGRRYGHSHHINISRNKIHDCAGAGISVIQADYVTVDRNEVFNNAWYSVYANSGISLYQNWSSDNNTNYKMFVTNNLVYNNRQYIPWIATGTITDGNGIIIDDSRNTQSNSTLGEYTGRTLVVNNITFGNGGSGIHAFLSDHVDIINNTAYLNNQSPEITGGQIFANTASDVRIVNNILYAYPNKKVNSNWDNSNVIYENNLYFNSPYITVMGSNAVVADPKFVNPSLDPKLADFRLQSTSPAIDAGVSFNSGTKFTKIDYLGNVRPRGLAYDIGAYEY
jgi:uncharacterized protein YfiM (DUF2279 family)